MLASIISSKKRWSKMLAFSIDYYGIFFRATQSVELFCTYLTTTIFLSVTCYNVTMLSLGVIQNTKPALFVRVPQFKPFVKQVLWNAEALTELFYGAKGGKVLSQKTQNKEQAETGVKRLGENGERTDSNRIKRTFVYGIQAIFISKESKCNRPEYLAGDRV